MFSPALIAKGDKMAQTYKTLAIFSLMSGQCTSTVIRIGVREVIIRIRREHTCEDAIIRITAHVKEFRTSGPRYYYYIVFYIMSSKPLMLLPSPTHTD